MLHSDDASSGIPHHVSPYTYVQTAYGGAITPFTAGPAVTGSWWLHLSLTMRDFRLTHPNSYLLVDVFGKADKKVSDLRNEVLKANANPSSPRIRLRYAHALSHRQLDPATLPWPAVQYWDQPITVEQYLAQIGKSARRGLLVQAFYEEVHHGRTSTLVVEAFRNKEQCHESHRRRRYSRYFRSNTPTQIVNCWIISARLPDHEHVAWIM